MLSLY